MARAFDSHPMTSERVRRAQEELSSMLPPKDDYVVTTSELNDVKARLAALVNHHLGEDAANHKPTLRKSASGSSEEEKAGRSEEDRPTLKRSTGN